MHTLNEYVTEYTIPFHSIQTFLSTLYAQKERAKTKYQIHCCIRDILFHKHPRNLMEINEGKM